jgi:hypothetical protein
MLVTKSHLFLTLLALIVAVSQAEGATEESFGAWRVICENKECTSYQYGVGGSSPVILRIKRGTPPAPEILIEGGPFDASGIVNIIIDGRDIGGGPVGRDINGEVDTVVFEPDDITLGLSRQMKKAVMLTIELPTSRGLERIIFSLDGYSAAMKRVEAPPD